MTVQTDGTLSGYTYQPFTGKHQFGTNGQLIAEITSDGVNTNTYTLYLNASQDTLILTSSEQSTSNDCGITRSSSVRLPLWRMRTWRGLEHRAVRHDGAIEDARAPV